MYFCIPAQPIIPIRTQLYNIIAIFPFNDSRTTYSEFQILRKCFNTFVLLLASILIIYFQESKTEMRLPSGYAFT
ncbi:hypothetical protein ASZ90_006662 [hydrocarbon metagenome]|uniref:Uncharacterized protein n=1 Tax=hydrocarbon metagenome TaxID=938273 RepID=A0A0W8FRY4_9ZZZZ